MIELIILGIISHAGKPIHGYEIKKYMKKYDFSEYAPVSYGSIYYNLGRMEKEGLIKGMNVKDTQRPERRLYQITTKGKTRLMKLLRQNYFEIQRLYHSFDIGVFMMALMPRDEVLSALGKRITSFQELLKVHRKKRDELKGKIPVNAVAILEHALYYFEAERKWLEHLLRVVDANEELWKGGDRNHLDDLHRREKAHEHGRN